MLSDTPQSLPLDEREEALEPVDLAKRPALQDLLELAAHRFVKAIALFGSFDRRRGLGLHRRNATAIRV